jgi:hypothetical protein
MTRAEHTARVMLRLATEAGLSHTRFYLHTVATLLTEIDRLRGSRRASWSAAQDKRRANGRCIGCGGRAGERWYCRPCRIRRSDADKKRSAA